MSAVRSLIDSLWNDGEKDFPVFPGNEDGDREKHDAESVDVSRVSRISRPEKQGLAFEDRGSSLLVHDDAGAGARSEFVSKEPGNPGTPGNDSLHNGFLFPVEISKTGKREIPFAGEPQAGPRLSAGAARSGWADLDRVAPAAAATSETVEQWRDAFYALNSANAPCPGFVRNMDWRETFDAARAFLEQHAESAHTFGWTTLDLFGVHHVVGSSRVDCCGAIVLAAGTRVSAVEADAIHFTRLRDGEPCGRFFRTSSTHEMIPVWSFGQ